MKGNLTVNGERPLAFGSALSKTIVERHGDSISVESHIREGSIFRVALTGGERNT